MGILRSLRSLRSHHPLPAVVASLLVVVVGCKSGDEPVATAPAAQPRVALRVTATAPVELIREDLHYLASDELEGRGVGTKGLDLAADYIAARFAALQLRPLPGLSDYYQHFDMSAGISVDRQKTSLSIGDTTLELSKQYTPTGFSGDGSFSGPVVFAGYGITNPERGYDDYEGIEVNGKVVLILRYEPHDAEGNSRFRQGDWSHHASLNAKVRNAADHGAAALMMVNPPKHHGADDDDELMSPSRGGARSAIPFVHVKREVAQDLLRRAGTTPLEALQAQIDESVKPHSFELKDLMVRGDVAMSREKAPVKNVLAYLPGREKPDEFVVVGAHYDHLGRGHGGSLARGSNQIHNGADDNASGTTAVLELARQMVESGPRQRSIVFALFTGEEWGLLGSEHFVEHPPVPLDRIIAMVNLDMVGRVRADTIYVGGTETAQAFDAIVKAADGASPLQVKGMQAMSSVAAQASDHYSFERMKIPSLFLFSGLHSDYHRPTDDAEKVNIDGIAGVVDFCEGLVDALATAPRPQYVAATQPAGAHGMSGAGRSARGARVSLGVMPDYGTDESTVGVRITGTSPGSPAEKAGLMGGDVIVQIDEMKIQNLYDLMDFLARGKPGDNATIVVDRNKQRVELNAVLVERGG
jgi:hypothetical protein